jgi:hypothetical protein
MKSPESNPVGYQWLAKRFEIQTVPYWRESRVLERGARRIVDREGKRTDYFPAARNPGDQVLGHLEFALKWEGLHLELLRKLMPLLDAGEVTALVRGAPTGRYARLIWWLYETFTGTRLDLPDLKTGNYVDLLDPEVYVTRPGEQATRQRIHVNLLGMVDFSPMVRKEVLGEWNEVALRESCQRVAEDYPPEIFDRAVRYLYAKESKSSHEIEREIPGQKRAERFIGLLEQAWLRDFLTKEALVELQQAIVDKRFANDGWRSVIDEQVYVGETLAPGQERIHYAAPKPEDLDELMAGFLVMAGKLLPARITARIRQGTFEPVVETLGAAPVPTLVAASVISFVFNFLHPFSDGNGRIHRLLLHHVLARSRFGPQGIILPVSAVILNRPREYDQALESFSKPLMERVEYTLDDRQRMTVTNDTADFYRYIDCTELTRIAIDFIRETIEAELPQELRFLMQYDEIRRRMNDVVELPNRHADLFVMLCRQNGGTLSKKKRELPEFAPLTDAEVAALEDVIRAVIAADAVEDPR